MPEIFLSSTTLHCGDCLVVLPTFIENSIDACVTDPPYHLTSIVQRFGADDAAPAQYGMDGLFTRASTGFMGKKWDGGDIAFRPETWFEVMRVLKPGAHLLAFGGTRTYHRMACAIEDAGFEIRDCIMWVYGAGFPKNHAVNRSPMFCQCAAIGRNDESIDQGHTSTAHTGREGAYQRGAPQCADVHHSTHIGQGYPGDCLPDCGLDGELPLSAAIDDQVSSPSRRHAQAHNRSSGHDDAQAYGSGYTPFPAPRSDHLSSRDCLSRERSESAKLTSSRVSMSRADIYESGDHKQGSDRGLSSRKYGMGFPLCQVCGKPNVDGYGTSLKPAVEPIILARKPLSEGTVAANVLKWGTGAINVDGCRVPHLSEADRASATPQGRATSSKRAGSAPDVEREGRQEFERPDTSRGRWPANLIHDGSEEVLALFPESESQSGGNRGSSQIWGSATEQQARNGFDDSGSAARFFYTAKADFDDRIGSKHPTVKPLDLMQYLVRLITSKGGLVIDPFAGTGTTGEAAFREGMRAVLIEAEAEYQFDIRRRMQLIMAGSDERLHASIKAAGKVEPVDTLPLFSGMME